MAEDAKAYAYLHPVGPTAGWAVMDEKQVRALTDAGLATAAVNAVDAGYVVGNWSVSVHSEMVGMSARAEDYPELDEDLEVPPQTALRFEAPILRHPKPVGELWHAINGNPPADAFCGHHVETAMAEGAGGDACTDCLRLAIDALEDMRSRMVEIAEAYAAIVNAQNDAAAACARVDTALARPGVARDVFQLDQPAEVTE